MQESGVNRKGNRIPGNMGMGMNGIPGNVGSYRAFEKKSPSLFCWSTGDGYGCDSPIRELNRDGK